MDLPKPYEKFVERYPEVSAAYEQFGEAAHAAGPLDEEMRALVKLGIATGMRMEGAVHAHTRKALEAGASREAIRQVVVLSAPTIGFPNMMAAMTWVDDVLEGR